MCGSGSTGDAICMVMGIIFSYFVATPTGATIVIFNVMAFLVAKAVEVLRG